MATLAATLVYESSRLNSVGSKVPSSKVYTFASGATGTYTIPINIEGAKSVWVSSVAEEAMTYYIPSYTSAGPELSTTTTYDLMTSSAAAVVYPTAGSAGLVSGIALPPYLSVKITGATATIVTMIVNY